MTKLLRGRTETGSAAGGPSSGLALPLGLSIALCFGSLVVLGMSLGSLVAAGPLRQVAQQFGLRPPLDVVATVPDATRHDRIEPNQTRARLVSGARIDTGTGTASGTG